LVVLRSPYIIGQVLSTFAKHAHVAIDIGCGSGRNMQVPARHADVVTGLDRSPAILELAAARGMPVAQGDGQSLPFASVLIFSPHSTSWNTSTTT
jgi:predicted TPR repeat methyltransferase